MRLLRGGVGTQTHVTPKPTTSYDFGGYFLGLCVSVLGELREGPDHFLMKTLLSLYFLLGTFSRFF